MFRFISAMAIILLLAAAGCASETPPPEHEDRSYGVIIAEAWDQKVELAPQGILQGIGRTGEKLGKASAKGGAAIGCVSGAIAITVVAPGAFRVGCVAGGAAVALPFFVLGYGIGAIAGTLEVAANAVVKGTKIVAGDEEVPIDIAPLLAAFKETNPSSAMRFALDEAAEERYRLETYTFVTKKFAIEDQPLNFLDRVPKRIKLADEDAQKIADAGNSHILVLLIHRFDVTTKGVVTPVSRLNVHVSGELRTTANKRLNTWLWTYQSDPVKPQTLAAENAELLRLEIFRAWHIIADKIISEVWQ